MKYFPGSFLLLILLFSCARKENKNVLPENKMREVMWDLIRADQYVADYLMRDSTRNKKDESMKLYEEIFHLHKISRDQFKRSLAYYSSQPDLLRPIIDSLAKRKSEFMFPPTGAHAFPADSSNKPTFHRQVPKR